MFLFIAADHAGEKTKNLIINNLTNINFKEIDIPNHPFDDYPDFAFKLCQKVLDYKTLGVLICGNGIGMSIAANKVKGIRSARCLTEQDAYRARNHNGINVLTLDSSQEISEILKIIKTFVSTPEPTEERHIRRVNKIKEYENNAS